MYQVFLVTAVFLGWLDWRLKGQYEWDELDELRKGWSWHLYMFVPYFVLCLTLSYLYGWENLFFLFGYINQDAVFYIIKSFKTGKLEYNSWFPADRNPLWDNARFYYVTVAVINGALIWI